MTPLFPLLTTFHRLCRLIVLPVLSASLLSPAYGDHVRDLQTAAVESGRAAFGHWGAEPDKYSTWGSHSNRLIPVYSFGLSLQSVQGGHSAYRSEQRLREIYGYLPDHTLNPQADYFDQTDLYRLQQQAVAAGKRRVILMVFDGMDWETTRAAAIVRSRRVLYAHGRGTGLHFQDYRGVPTEFGLMVTSPHNDGTEVDVNAQKVLNPGGKSRGGYAAAIAGFTAGTVPSDPLYLIGKGQAVKHAYTDSSSSASSMTAGRKTYNNAVNVDAAGAQFETLGHQLQRQGFAIGVVTSVPISHATPACTWSHNVERDDYQDLTRDLLGRPSVSHPGQPLPAVDVLIGCGWGETQTDVKKAGQGKNFVPGNRYLTEADLHAVDAAHGGEFVIGQRTPGRRGGDVLREAAAASIQSRRRLLGYFGVKNGHLPFQTADGQFDPTVSQDKPAEKYSAADRHENPVLADMAVAALDVLASRSDRFWMLLEAGDVDWANHSNNIDNSVGAVFSGDAAFKAVTDWIEAHGGWNDTAVIVTADHGHYLVLDQPELLAGPAAR